jgi:hypothetical protein
MFIVTLVLNEVIAWMRNQSGTSSLRAILYMDEIFGYFPPTANPPSKTPMLTLLKQARAFGVGVVLATQNPVDLDYKGLSNCGTWLIGRLQTERDKLRLIEGLQGALGGDGPDRGALERMMSALAQRVFLVRNVHDDAPYLMKSRWALSYLRGPMTGPEISRVMAPRKAALAAVAAARVGSAGGATGSAAIGGAGRGAAASADASAADRADASGVSYGTSGAATATPRPALQGDVAEYFLPATRGDGPITYQPRVLGLARLHFIDAKLALDQWSNSAWLAPLDDAGKEALWAEGVASADLKSRLTRTPATGAAFGSLPGPAMRAATYANYAKGLTSHLYENLRAELRVCDALKATSNPGESEGDFRTRLALSLREKRDADAEALRRKYAPRLTTLQDQIRRAQERVERERGQASQQKMQAALSVGASILGAFLGRKTLSSANIGRATTAARAATRIGKESQDVDRASESVEVLQQRYAALESELTAELANQGAALDASSISLRAVSVTPRKSDIAVGEVALVWAPYRRAADGFPAPAFD